MQDILVVDDDHDVAESIELALRRRGFHVQVACSGVEALKQLRRHRPSLVILDVMMPGMDGFEVCRRLRTDERMADLPIIFLTARAQGRDRIEGLRAGADDYLCKPFNLEELILRVQAVLRRYQPEKKSDRPEIIKVGDLELSSRTFVANTPDKGEVLLTPTEFDLLYHLMLHAGEVFSSELLLQQVWDFPYETGSTDLVRAHIKNLREKIEPDSKHPTYLLTIPRHGYVLTGGA